MAVVKKDEIREGFQGILEGFALIEVNAMRQLAEVQRGRAAVKEEWRRFDLGEFPEYEPEIRMRQVS